MGNMGNITGILEKRGISMFGYIKKIFIDCETNPNKNRVRDMHNHTLSASSSSSLVPVCAVWM